MVQMTNICRFVFLISENLHPFPGQNLYFPLLPADSIFLIFIKLLLSKRYDPKFFLQFLCTAMRLLCRKHRKQRRTKRGIQDRSSLFHILRDDWLMYTVHYMQTHYLSSTVVLEVYKMTVHRLQWLVNAKCAVWESFVQQSFKYESNVGKA